MPVLLAGGAGWLGRKLVVAGKVLVVMGVVALSVLAGRQLVRHVIASPRFAVKEIRVAATTHVPADEIEELSGVAIGDRLLTVDPDRGRRQAGDAPLDRGRARPARAAVGAVHRGHRAAGRRRAR